MGRSCGGLTTKIHVFVDAEDLPIVIKLTPGQAHDGRSAEDMLATVGAGDILLGDRTCDGDALLEEMAARGAWANIKPMPNRKHVPAFSAFLYKCRNLAERFFNRLRHFRAVATQYDKRDDNFLASVRLESIRFWLRHNESVT
jgi:transposase